MAVLDIHKRLEILLTNILNNPKDFTVEQLMDTLIGGNYLICQPNNLTASQYNWLADLMAERYEQLKEIQLKEPPKKLEDGNV